MVIIFAALGLSATRAAARPAGPAAASDDQRWLDSSQSPSMRANELLAAMTLADKVLMLHGARPGAARVRTDGYLPGIARLGVPPVTMTDGAAGIRNHQKATELPAPISLAASWDDDLAQRYGQLIGREARDRGQDQVFGPALNIDRVARNGRNFEYLSEDPLLSGTIAGYEARGIQGTGVIATLKHYLANNSETNRMTVSADVPDRALHEIYEKDFGVAVAVGHPGSVMCAYNRVGDVYNCSNAETLGELRRLYGFDGYVVSDYPATHATTDLAAGLNVELAVGRHLTLPDVRTALANGSVTQAQLDHRVYETLFTMFRLGLFDRSQGTSPIDANADAAAAEQLEQRGAVLLKNERSVLPLTAADRNIAIIGTTAKTSAQGGGSSRVDPLSVDNAYSAVAARAASRSPSLQVTYNPGTDATAAAAAARGADVALVFVRDHSGEGSDRSTLSLPGNQNAVVRAVAAANPHTVVMLETGGPALLPWLSSVAGVVEAWYPGARGGQALARLLFGDADFSGRLQQTWPTSDAQVPTATASQFPGVHGEEQYSEGVDVGYRWYDATNHVPLFPFGYGLSYASFSFTDLSLTASSGGPGDPVTAAVDVTDNGGTAGTEVVQAYVARPGEPAGTPPRELAAYATVSLAAGQTKRVHLTVEPRELSHWDGSVRAFRVADGEYRLAVGGSSRSLPLSRTYTVSG